MGLDIKFIPEYKKDGVWHHLEISEDYPIYGILHNRLYQQFALFGPKWRTDYEHFPTLPFLKPLPKQTPERFEENPFKHKYTTNSMRDVYEIIEQYDCSEYFALYHDPYYTMFNSTVYIKEALEFDYDQIAVDNMTWREILDEWWFTIINYFNEKSVEQVHISFGH